MFFGLGGKAVQPAAPSDPKIQNTKLNQNSQPVIQPKAVIKVILIGPQCSGKSSILLSFVDSKFQQNYISTIGVYFKIKTVPYYNQYYKLQLWDTAGQQIFRSITNCYYKGGHCLYLIYDCTNLQEFNKLGGFLKLIEEHAATQKYVCLVGTKCDLQDKKQVSTQMGMQFALQNDIDFMQVSSVNGYNLDDLFMKGVKWFVNNYGV